MESLPSVLVVDDDASLREAYRRRLGRSWSVHVTGCPLSAVAIAKEHPPVAAILDLHLEHGTSIPLMRELKNLQPDLRVAIVSGYLTTEATVIAVQAGASAVFDKPIHPDEVLHRLASGPLPDVFSRDTPTLAEATDAHIQRVLADCDGNISETARRLGIFRTSLQRRLRKQPVRLVRQRT